MFTYDVCVKHYFTFAHQQFPLIFGRMQTALDLLLTEDNVICSFFIPKFSIPKALLQTKKGIKNPSPSLTPLTDFVRGTEKIFNVSCLKSKEPVSTVVRKCTNTIKLRSRNLYHYRNSSSYLFLTLLTHFSHQNKHLRRCLLLTSSTPQNAPLIKNISKI